MIKMALLEIMCPKGLERLRGCKFDHFRGFACQPYDVDALMNPFRHLMDRSKLEPLP